MKVTKKTHVALVNVPDGVSQPVFAPNAVGFSVTTEGISYNVEMNPDEARVLGCILVGHAAVAEMLLAASQAKLPRVQEK